MNIYKLIVLITFAVSISDSCMKSIQENLRIILNTSNTQHGPLNDVLRDLKTQMEFWDDLNQMSHHFKYNHAYLNRQDQQLDAYIHENFYKKDNASNQKDLINLCEKMNKLNYKYLCKIHDLMYPKNTGNLYNGLASSEYNTTQQVVYNQQPEYQNITKNNAYTNNLFYRNNGVDNNTKMEDNTDGSKLINVKNPFINIGTSDKLDLSVHSDEADNEKNATNINKSDTNDKLIYNKN